MSKQFRIPSQLIPILNQIGSELDDVEAEVGILGDNLVSAFADLSHVVGFDWSGSTNVPVAGDVEIEINGVEKIAVDHAELRTLIRGIRLNDTTSKYTYTAKATDRVDLTGEIDVRADGDQMILLDFVST